MKVLKAISKPKKRRKKKTLTSMRKEAKAAFQKWVRLDEVDDMGFGRCASCGASVLWKAADGGHYIPAQSRATEFVRENVHIQCKKCNGFLEGNTVLYKNYIIRWYGVAGELRLQKMHLYYQGNKDMLNELSEEDRAMVTVIKDYDYYYSVKKEYTEKCRELQEVKGL